MTIQHFLGSNMYNNIVRGADRAKIALSSCYPTLFSWANQLLAVVSNYCTDMSVVNVILKKKKKCTSHVFMCKLLF